MSIFDNLQFPKIIYEVESKYNGKIYIVQIGDTRKIRVDNTNQSISHFSPLCKNLVWGKVAQVLKDNEPDLKNVMILGLGGATMQHLIAQAYPGIKILSVEIDPVMVDIAKKFFDLDLIQNHKIIVDDAMRVVVEPEKYEIAEYSFQALVVDIYVGERYPDLGKSGNFIAALKRLVVPGGLIIFNRIYWEHHQDEVNAFIEYISENLNDVKNLVIAGYTNSDNVLIFGRT